MKTNLKVNLQRMFGVSSLGAYLQAKFFGSLSSYTDTRNLSTEILNRQPQSTEDQRFFNQIPKRIGSKPKIFPASYDAASFDAAPTQDNLQSVFTLPKNHAS